MKNLFKFLFSLLIIVTVAIVLFLGYLGLIPTVAKFFGSDKPRDLGVRFTEADHTSAMGKIKQEIGTLPDTTPAGMSVVRSGSRPAKVQMTSAEATSLMNNRPWKYWPYKDVQMKFNNDGSAEMSGIILKDRIGGYGEFIGAPRPAVDFVLRFLPANPVFYTKMRVEFADNKMSVFDPQVFELGRMPLPMNALLAHEHPRPMPQVYAQSGDIIQELGKVNNKKQLIIDFVNSFMAKVASQGFYAKSAKVSEGKLMFDGNIPEKESFVR